MVFRERFAALIFCLFIRWFGMHFAVQAWRFIVPVPAALCFGAVLWSLTVLPIFVAAIGTVTIACAWCNWLDFEEEQ